MNTHTFASIEKHVLDGGLLSRQQAEFLVDLEQTKLNNLFGLAEKVRRKLFGNKVRCCSIVAAKVGGCNQDCAFCSQSVRHKTHVKDTSLLEPDEIYKAALIAASNGAESVGIVTSGHKPSNEQIERWGNTINQIRSAGRIRVCTSMGIVDNEQAQRLARFGTQRYNLNLQTSRRFYPHIVTTHQYDDRIRAIEHLKNAGIGICCGALFGMGETWSDRLDLAFELRDLDVDVVPINFLIPIDGTPLADNEPLDPVECLRIIAIYRLILPRQQIKVAGGREACLKDMQNMIFAAGADSFLIGNYLTTCGREPESDRQMVRNLGLDLALYRPEKHPSLTKQHQNA